MKKIKQRQRNLVAVRLTDSEFNLLSKLCKKEGLKKSTLFRHWLYEKLLKKEVGQISVTNTNSKEKTR